MTALYIHGFASTGNSGKVEQLRTFLDEDVLAPSLTHQPKRDLETLQSLVREHNVTTVVGSSLGGFYALALGQRFDLRLVLINPSLRPYETLVKHLGSVAVFGTDATFAWTETEVEELREIGAVVEEALDLPNSGLTWKNVLVLLAKNDEVLDARKTTELLKFARVILDPNEDHRFSNIRPYAESIRATATAPSFIGA